MSASGSSQRPKTTRPDIESEQMPFEAAEALLWGRKTHKDHEWLFLQMKELQSQHESYDARIKATEAIAETAEAATHRIRHMETKLGAIESDDKDRPFDKWAENAITQLKLFADNNLNVRQKLNSLEGRFCEAVDDLDKVSGVSKDVASLIRRLDVLEKERKEDKNQLMLMGREIACFRAMRQMPPSGHALQTNPIHLEMPHSGQAADHGSHDSDTTTEEDHIPLSRSLVQVPRSPSVNLERPKPILKLRATKGTQSARMNIMRRPSIFSPRVSQATRKVQPRAQMRPTSPHSAKPHEQSVNVNSRVGKRERDEDVPTQRVTRAKVGEAARSKQHAILINTGGAIPVENRPVPQNQAKQKLVVVLQTHTQTQRQSVTHEAPAKNALTKNAPTKNAPRRPDGPSCRQCRQQHQGCDRARPVCGRCTKSGAGVCEYPDTQVSATQPALRLSHAQKKNNASQARRPAKSPAHHEAIAKSDESTRTKPSVPRSNRQGSAIGTSSVDSVRATRSRRLPKILTDATDLETFLKM